VLAVEDQVVRHVAVGGDSVAYSVVGTGPPLLVGGWWCSHLTLNWQDPGFRGYMSRLADRHAVIRYDRPGSGASDRSGRVPEDLDAEIAVMSGLIDALGLDRVAVIGASSAAAVAAGLAATRPDVVERLVLYGAFARGEDIATPSARAMMLDVIAGHWGLGSRLLADVFIPGATNDEREAFAQFQRQSATPEEAAGSLAAAYSLDATAHLAALSVRTTVLHRKDDRAVPFALGLDVARQIRGSTFVELEGEDHFPWRGDADAVADATLRALGHHVPAKPVPPGPDAITDREREILRLVADGLTDAQIGERLVLSPHTVHRHIANARTKLGVRSRAAAATALMRPDQ
jgi:pimeloyl-ACP methyl ester carboxylesterase/DNA-binding CsgD family transcriptional regulator